MQLLTGSPIAPQPPISASTPLEFLTAPKGVVPPTLGTTGLDALGAVIEKTKPLIQSFSVPEGP